MEIYAEGLTRAALLDARFPHSFRQGQTEGCEFQKSPPTLSLVSSIQNMSSIVKI